VTATREPTDIDLTEVEADIDTTSYGRGASYARRKRVLSLSWDESSSMWSARVVGNGAVYSTAAYFSAEPDGLSFEMGECSCPIGYNCEHVAAVVISAARDGLIATRTGPGGTSAQPGKPAEVGTPRRPDTPRAAREPARDAPPPAVPVPSWEGPLRSLMAPAAAHSSGNPLAIELTLTLTLTLTGGGGGPGAPRLQARLMREGARGGWVNGSLSWGSLESWNLRDGNYREDHLALARELQAIHQTRQARSARYHYGYANSERTLDVSDWEGGQLWSLLDESSRLGLVTVHARHEFGEVPRYRHGELVLDVTGADEDAARVTPSLRIDGDATLETFEPVLFLGASGHGLVLAERRGKDTPVDLERRPLRLVRLARPTPLALQRMVQAGEALRVPAGDLGRFATEVAPALRNIAPVVSSDDSFTTPEVSAPQLVLRAGHGADHITRTAWEWIYTIGDSTMRAPLRINGDGPGFRDPEAERAILDTLDLGVTGLAELGLLDVGGRPADGAALLGGFDTVRFVTEALPALGELLEVHVEVSGEPLDYRDAGDSLQIGVGTAAVASERDWFDLEVTITVEGTELPFTEVFAALARGETRMLLADGAHFSLLAPQLQSLRELIEEARALGEGSRPGSLRISRYQAGLWEELAQLGVVREQAEGWQRQVEGLLGLKTLTDHEPPTALTASLRPYQVDGFRWLATLWGLRLGGILADDMGLGKTLQTLALICHARAHGTTEPFLVVAPTSVVSGWVTEADRFAPELVARALTDTLGRSGCSLQEVAAGADVVVTTYTLLRLDADQYGTVPWAGVILDEAQYVKNHNGKTHAAVRRLDAPVKLAITGTPMENNLTELWALLSITAPGLFPDPKAFNDQYARPIERGGDRERLARLRRRIRPLVKRRTKELVAADLPAKQEQTLAVTLNARHRKLYDTHLQRERQRILGLLDDFDHNRFTVLTAITRLRQLSLHPGLVDDKHLSIPSAKVEALTEQLTDVIDGGHRALVFSQFTGFLGLVRERLNREGISHCYLDGKTRRRDRILHQFKEGDEPVFLISLKAGGFGLNLTEADYCFLLDPWWNPAAEAQAIDRTHRIGQTRPVMVYRLVADDTIEQKVVALARRKADLFRSAIDDGDLFAAGIEAEDIRGLLS
jgi:superfamily II DNA or RNA helicase